MGWVYRAGDRRWCRLASCVCEGYQTEFVSPSIIELADSRRAIISAVFCAWRGGAIAVLGGWYGSFCVFRCFRGKGFRRMVGGEISSLRVLACMVPCHVLIADLVEFCIARDGEPRFADALCFDDLLYRDLVVAGGISYSCCDYAFVAEAHDPHGCDGQCWRGNGIRCSCIMGERFERSVLGRRCSHGLRDGAYRSSRWSDLCFGAYRFCRCGNAFE